jgi:hypothetical protein
MMDLAFLRRRLRPSEYLGLHFIFGLLIAAVCLWLFSDLTEDVVTRDPVVQVDLAVAEKLQALSSPIVTTIMVLFTTLGDFVTVGFCLTGLVVLQMARAALSDRELVDNDSWRRTSKLAPKRMDSSAPA